MRNRAQTNNHEEGLTPHMGYRAGEQTLAHIAALVCAERPHWEEGLVKTILRAHAANVSGTDLAIASLRLALDDTIHTPKAIGWRGAHWRGLSSTPPSATLGPRCRTCGKREADCLTQRPRTADPDDHPFEPREEP